MVEIVKRRHRLAALMGNFVGGKVGSLNFYGRSPTLESARWFLGPAFPEVVGLLNQSSIQRGESQGCKLGIERIKTVSSAVRDH